jgi:hypothetical protein
VRPPRLERPPLRRGPAPVVGVLRAREAAVVLRRALRVRVLVVRRVRCAAAAAAAAAVLAAAAAAAAAPALGAAVGGGVLEHGRARAALNDGADVGVARRGVGGRVGGLHLGDLVEQHLRVIVCVCGWLHVCVCVCVRVWSRCGLHLGQLARQHLGL